MKTHSRRHDGHHHSGHQQKSDTPFFTSHPVHAKNESFFQAKLAVGQPGDQYEQEADAMADKVVQRLSDNKAGNPEENESRIQTKSPAPLSSNFTPFNGLQAKCAACEQEEKLQQKGEVEAEDLVNGKLQKKPIFETEAELPGPNNNIQTKCAECEKEDEEKAQAKSEKNSAQTTAPVLEGSLSSSKGGGAPLPEDTRSQMESSFGVDFSQVRIHDGSLAIQMSRSLNAQAFTHGSDIYFNSGRYNLDKNGQHLLAHELTHVVQQNSNVDVQRQPEEGVSEAKKTQQVPFPSREEEIWVNGIQLSESVEWLNYLVKNVIAARGKNGGRWLMDQLQDEISNIAVSLPAAGVSDEMSESVNRKEKIQRIYNNLETIVPQIETENNEFLIKFYDQVQKTALQILNTNEERTKSEMIRYGISWKVVQDPEPKWMLDCSERPCARVLQYAKPETHYSLSGNLPAVAGLQSAASILLDRREKLEAKRDEVMGAVKWEMDCSERPCARILVPSDRWAPLNKEADELKQQYENLLFVLSQDYPVLSHFAAVDVNINTLKKLAKTPPDQTIAELLGARMKEQLNNIETVRKGIGEDEVEFWRLPEVVNLTKVVLGVQKNSMEDKLVDEKVGEEQPGALQAIALLVMDAIAILLAPVTGGASLGLAAVVNIAVSAKDVKEYMLNKAMANTDFDRAKGLSQEDPSLFWLAVSIVGVVPELGDALKLFRIFGKAVKNMKIAKTAEEIIEIERAVKATAKEMKVADEVVTGILARAKNQDESLKVLGVTEKEIESLKAAGKVVDNEALANSVGVANAAINGEVKVSRTGWIFSCTSPCTMLREKYASQLANDANAAGELTRLEAEAASAATDEFRKEIANKAAALEARLRKVPLKTWKSPLEGSKDFEELVKKRGSIAPNLDRKPEGWTGAMEARFKYGDKSKLEPGYRWVLERDGSLRIDRLDKELPKIYFDEEEKVFKEVIESSTVKIESTEEMMQMAHLGRGATSTADWYGRLRKGIQSLENLSDDALGRVLKLAPNIDHMKGQLLEEIAAEILKKDPRLSKKGIQFIPGHSVRDAAGKQLSDGIFVRRNRDGSMQIVSIIESKAGAASAGGLKRSYKRFSDLTDGELKSLRGEAIEELRIRKGLDPEMITVPDWAKAEELMRTHRDEIDAIMKEIHTSDIGQVEKDLERLVPNVDSETTTILIDGKPMQVKASYKTTNIVAVTPNDVSIKGTIEALAESGITAKGLDVGLNAETLEGVARQLRAEQVVNAPVMGKK